MLKDFLLLIRNSSWYLIGNALLVFLGVILLPLYTRFLTPDDYGITAIAASVTGFLAAFYNLGLMAAYNRFYFDYKDDPEQLKRHISTIVLFLSFYGLALTLLLTIFGKPIEAFTPGVPFSPYIQLAICSSYFSLLFQLRLRLYQTEQKADKYFIFFVAHVLFTIGITIFLVVFQERGALGYIAAGLISNFVFSLASFWLLRGYLIRWLDIPKLKMSLRYGLPLVPHTFSGWMSGLADRMILNSLVNTAVTGIYSIGHTIGGAIAIVATSVSFAWGPLFFSLMKDKGDAAKGEVARFATYWVLVMCLAFLLVSVFSREIVTVFAAPQYREAYRVVPLIALGLLFGGFYYIVVGPLFWLGRTNIIATATVTAGLLNVGLNFLFIPGLQMMGAALATALSHLFVFGAIAYFSLRSFPIPYEYKRLLKIVVVTSACYLVSLPIANLAGFWITFAAKLPVIVLFPVLLILARFPEEEEKKTAKQLLRRGSGKIFPGKGKGY